MKLIDSLTMQERLFLLALLGGNGVFWGTIAGVIVHLCGVPYAVAIGAIVAGLVAWGTLRFLEAIHDHKQDGRP